MGNVEKKREGDVVMNKRETSTIGRRGWGEGGRMQGTKGVRVIGGGASLRVNGKWIWTRLCLIQTTTSNDNTHFSNNCQILITLIIRDKLTIAQSCLDHFAALDPSTTVAPHLFFALPFDRPTHATYRENTAKCICSE